jgi:hypothetical protein
MSVEVIQAPLPQASPPRPRRRTALVVTVAVLALVALTWALVVRAQAPVRPSLPLYGADDGLPAVLQAGQQYTAELVVAIGPDWARVAEGDGRADIVAIAGTTQGLTTDPVLLCSGTVVPGSALRLSCPITAPAVPGDTLRIIFGVGPVYGDPGSAEVAAYNHTYEHAVG